MAKAWGQAKVEIIALREEILTRLQSGIPIKQLYDELKSRGRVTVSQPSFYRLVKRITEQPTNNSRSASKTTSNRPATVKQKQSASPVVEAGFKRIEHQDQQEFDALWNGNGGEE